MSPQPTAGLKGSCLVPFLGLARPTAMCPLIGDRRQLVGRSTITSWWSWETADGQWDTWHG